MVAAYLRAKFPGPATEAVLAMADVGEKEVEYSTGVNVDTMWWMWQILRSMLPGSRRQKVA
jgi:hypothetical protein